MRRVVSQAVLAVVLTIVGVGVPASSDAQQGPQQGRYVVKFQPGRSNAGQAALRAAGAQIVLPLDPQDAVAAIIPAPAVAGLSRNPNIEYIEEDVIRTPMATWNDRALASGEILPFGAQMVQADLVVSSVENAKKVCIIDSGYSQQHADLRDADAAITQKATDSGSGTWDQDSCGHGTHVAGTILATPGNGTGVIGVIPGVRLHVVKVFGNDTLVEGGSCSWTYSSNLINALNSCEANGANVTSMSLGGALKSRTEENAFKGAYNRGMLHVAAAGNGGNNTTSYPAGYASVISVAAVDANETVASFSQKNRDAELAAPGVGVLSTVPWLDMNTPTFVNATSISGGHVEFSARTSGVTGPLVDGGLCTSVGAWAGLVVLCQRGTNSFNEKVQNVKNGGGVAAVIYNSVASDPGCGDFAGTLGDGNTNTIPAISVSCSDGTQALQHAAAVESGTLLSQFSAPASGYDAWDGTSMATPHVSGVAGLIWSCHPSATNAQIRSAMQATARDKGAAGRDNAYGYGIVQTKAAVDALGASSCTLLSVSKY